MKLKETVILYQYPNAENNLQGRIKLIPYGTKGNFREFSCSSGACYLRIHEMADDQLTYYLFNHAMHLIIRDGLDPKIVHNAFCEIKEYRDGLAYDVPIPEHLQQKFKKENNGDLFTCIVLP